MDTQLAEALGQSSKLDAPALAGCVGECQAARQGAQGDSQDHEADGGENHVGLLHDTAPQEPLCRLQAGEDRRQPCYLIVLCQPVMLSAIA